MRAAKRINKMRKLILFLVLLFIASPLFATTNCEIRDISGVRTNEELQILKLTKMGWTRSATVCQMGEFEIATPSDEGSENQNTIFLFRKGKPVFYRQDGGTYVYSPKLEDAAFDRVLVHIWHGNDEQEIKRLWYTTVDKEPSISIDDTNFDGQPDIKTVWKGNELIEMYKWSEHGWLPAKTKKETSNNPIKATR